MYINMCEKKFKITEITDRKLKQKIKSISHRVKDGTPNSYIEDVK